MTDTTPLPPETPPPSDEAVLAYLGAIETGRAAPDTLPHPDEAAGSLAGAEMMHGEEEGDDLAGQLGAWTPGNRGNIERLEPGFVAAAADYGRRHHISYEGWRQAGVAPEVLERAGIRPEEG